MLFKLTTRPHCAKGDGVTMNNMNMFRFFLCLFVSDFLLLLALFISIFDFWTIKPLLFIFDYYDVYLPSYHVRYCYLLLYVGEVTVIEKQNNNDDRGTLGDRPYHLRKRLISTKDITRKCHVDYLKSTCIVFYFQIFKICDCIIWFPSTKS